MSLVTAQQLLALLEEEPRMLGMAEVRQVVLSWLSEFDRAEVCGDAGWNDMHVAGAALAQVLAQHTLDCDLLEAEHAARESFPALFCVRDAEGVAGMHPQQLLDFVMNVQVRLHTLFELTPDSYVCQIDLVHVFIAVLRELGRWLGVDLQRPDSELQQVMDPLGDADEWHRLRADVAAQILDGVHAVLSAHRLLVCATRAPASEPAELQQYHLEASRDSFYEMATIADCGVGLITQYKHKFRELFHSPTQVVYFHYPAYHRRNQKDLATLLAGDAPAVNVLALALQIEPDVPVLYEHTGLGHDVTHAKHAFAWVLIQDIILLVDSHMQAHCGSISELLALIQGAHTQPHMPRFY